MSMSVASQASSTDRKMRSRQEVAVVCSPPELVTIQDTGKLPPELAAAGEVTEVTVRSTGGGPTTTEIGTEMKLFSSDSTTRSGLKSTQTKRVTSPAKVMGIVTSRDRSADSPGASGVEPLKVPPTTTAPTGPVWLPVEETMIVSVQGAGMGALPRLVTRHETETTWPGWAMGGAIRLVGARSGSSRVMEDWNVSETSPVTPLAFWSMGLARMSVTLGPTVRV